MFQPGQRVVCVDDAFSARVRCLYTALPVKDVTYTIRGIAPGISIENPLLRTGQLVKESAVDDVAVYLEGLINPCAKAPPHREYGFKPERFRPLEEKETSENLEKPELVEA